MRDLYEAQDFCKSQNEAQFFLPKMHGRDAALSKNLVGPVVMWWV